MRHRHEREARRWLERSSGKVAPRISGTAYITAETTLVLDERDPFCWGMR